MADSTGVEVLRVLSWPAERREFIDDLVLSGHQRCAVLDSGCLCRGRHACQNDGCRRCAQRSYELFHRAVLLPSVVLFCRRGATGYRLQGGGGRAARPGRCGRNQESREAVRRGAGARRLGGLPAGWGAAWAPAPGMGRRIGLTALTKPGIAITSALLCFSAGRQGKSTVSSVSGHE